MMHIVPRAHNPSSIDEIVWISLNKPCGHAISWFCLYGLDRSGLNVPFEVNTSTRRTAYTLKFKQKGDHICRNQ